MCGICHVMWMRYRKMGIRNLSLFTSFYGSRSICLRVLEHFCHCDDCHAKWIRWFERKSKKEKRDEWTRSEAFIFHIFTCSLLSLEYFTNNELVWVFHLFICRFSALFIQIYLYVGRFFFFFFLWKRLTKHCFCFTVRCNLQNWIKWKFTEA